MSTEAQKNANKANAQKSTGPRTEPGKNRARFNARRHGLTGHIFALLPADEVAFAEHEKGVMESLKPVGHLEKTLVTQIARDYWRISGHSANEQNIVAWLHDDKFVDHTHGLPTPEIQAAAIRARVCLEIDFSPIPLYQSRIRRLINENMRDLRLLQTERLAGEATALNEAERLLKLSNMDNQPIDTKVLTTEIGLVFSTPALVQRLNHQLTLQRAAFYEKHNWDRSKQYPWANLRVPEAA